MISPGQGLGVDGLRRRADRRTTNALWMSLYGAGASSVIWWEGKYRWLGLAAWALVSLASGAHFWAFAWVLGVWQYVVTGALDCLFVLITLLAVSQASMVGSMPAWVFYPLLGGGVALLVTGALMLYESDEILRRLHATPNTPHT